MDTNNVSDCPTSIKPSLDSALDENRADALFQYLVEIESLIEVFLASDIIEHEPSLIHGCLGALGSLVALAKKLSEDLVNSPG